MSIDGTENNDPVQISCESCNHKPYDRWDENPEGFRRVNSYWLCEDCYQSQTTRLKNESLKELKRLREKKDLTNDEHWRYLCLQDWFNDMVDKGRGP